MPHVQPNPRSVSSGDENSAMRRFDCQMYSECLNSAAKARWASWSCDACHSFMATPKIEPKLRRGSSLAFEG